MSAESHALLTFAEGSNLESGGTFVCGFRFLLNPSPEKPTTQTSCRGCLPALDYSLPGHHMGSQRAGAAPRRLRLKNQPVTFKELKNEKTRNAICSLARYAIHC